MRSTKSALAAKGETSSIRWTDTDWQLIRKLQKATGAHNVSEVVRMGLRALAVKEGLK